MPLASGSARQLSPARSLRKRSAGSDVVRGAIDARGSTSPRLPGTARLTSPVSSAVGLRAVCGKDPGPDHDTCDAHSAGDRMIAFHVNCARELVDAQHVDDQPRELCKCASEQARPPPLGSRARRRPPRLHSAASGSGIRIWPSSNRHAAGSLAGRTQSGSRSRKRALPTGTGPYKTTGWDAT